MTRLVTIAGGKPDSRGLDALQGQLDGWKIGPRIRQFWEAWIDRESFKRTLVPASLAFQETRGTSLALLETESARMSAEKEKI